MDDTALMGVLHGRTNSKHEFQDLSLGELLVLNVEIQVLPLLQEFHGIIVGLVMDTTVIHACDIGVFQTGRQFDLKTSDLPRPSGSCRVTGPVR